MIAAGGGGGGIKMNGKRHEKYVGFATSINISLSFFSIIVENLYKKVYMCETDHSKDTAI
jgi:hypothetical protein